MIPQLRRRRPVPAAARSLIALAMLLTSMHAAAADAPAALVMELSGTTRPALAVHGELVPGTRVSLSPGASVALLHYVTCSIVTVSGGDVTVTAQGLEIAATARQSAKPGPCPRVHRITMAGLGPQSGVVVSRTIGTPTPPLVVAAGGQVLVTGDGSVKAAQLLDEAGKSVDAALVLRNQSVLLPQTLVLRRPYVLRLQIDGKSGAIDVPISTSGPAAGGLLVLRLE